MTFASLAAWTWGKWPDALVDFGRELYTPWVLSRGKVLGRDLVWYTTGPLSPYWNSLLFRLFGSGLRTLVFFNLALLAAMTSLLYAFVRELGDRFTATIAAIAFLCIFGFGHVVSIGNYNYVTPYSHGATHGMALSLTCIALLWRLSRTDSLRDAAGSGLCLGLVSLTKPEFLLACSAAFALGGGLIVCGTAPGRARWRLVAALTLTSLIPIAIAWGAMVHAAGPSLGTTMTWAPYVGMNTPIAHLPFYLKGLGFDAPGQNLWRAAAGFLTIAALFALAAILERRIPERAHAWVALAVAGTWILVAILWIPPRLWLGVGRPLPFVAGTALLISVASAWRRGRACSPREILSVTLSAFALGLLAKMVLNSRLHHYGFVLAMPATMLSITWMCAVGPTWMRARGGSGILIRALGTALIVIVTGAHVRASAAHYARKSVSVGEGADSFVADGRGEFMNAAMGAIDDVATRNTNLAVLPEGVMLNYLMRRETPSPHLTYMPDTLVIWGERDMLSTYRRSPPDLVLIVKRDAGEYGATLFGQDYARETLQWLQQTYAPVGTIGGSPLNLEGPYGMLLLRRRATSADAAAPSL